MSKYDTRFIDEEERALVQDIETTDVSKLRAPSTKEQKQIRRGAKKYIERQTKMNIRIDRDELEKIRAQAQKQGLKYQTLIKSVLHKYVTGQLVDKEQ